MKQMVRGPPARGWKQPCKPRVTQAMPTQGTFSFSSEAFPSASLGEQGLIKHFVLSAAESHRCFLAKTLSRTPNVSTSHTKLVRSQPFTVVLCVCLWCCMCLSNPLPVLDIRSGDGELPNAGLVQSKLCTAKIKTIISEEVLILG